MWTLAKLLTSLSLIFFISRIENNKLTSLQYNETSINLKVTDKINVFFFFSYIGFGTNM